MKSNSFNILAAGFLDGTIALYDNKSKYAKREFVKDNNSLLINLFTPDNEYYMIAGYESGDIKFWDMRNFKDPFKSFKILDGNVTSIDSQDCGKLLIGGSLDSVKVMNFTGDEISHINYDGLLGQRLAPVSCLSLHKYKPSLAVATTDAFMTVYSGNIKG